MEDKYISFFIPDIGEEEIHEVIACLKSGWLTTSQRAKQFETDFSEYIGMAHSVALNSCTAALHLGLEAVGLQEKELVLVPSFTFAATAEVVRYFKATPVLVDCNEDDFCMNMAQAAEILERIRNGQKVKGVPEDHGRARAIMPVHFAGQVADVIRCRELCQLHDLSMVEDCAHTCPAYYADKNGNMQMAGKSADIACYSFYANKTITTGEGGMAVTDNEEWADRMRVMSLHGISKDAWKRFSRSGSWYYEIVAPGFKYNITDIAASLGIHQLRKADSFWQRRRQIADMYAARLADVPGIVLPKEKAGRQHSWHLYIIKVQEQFAGIHRNELIEELKKAEIGTGVHYIPLHLHPYYRDTFGYTREDYPVASVLSEEVLSLPIYPLLEEAQVDRICETIKSIIKK